MTTQGPGAVPEKVLSPQTREEIAHHLSQPGASIASAKEAFPDVHFMLIEAIATVFETVRTLDEVRDIWGRIAEQPEASPGFFKTKVFPGRAKRLVGAIYEIVQAQRKWALKRDSELGEGSLTAKPLRVAGKVVKPITDEVRERIFQLVVEELPERALSQLNLDSRFGGYYFPAILRQAVAARAYRFHLLRQNLAELEAKLEETEGYAEEAKLLRAEVAALKAELAAGREDMAAARQMLAENQRLSAENEELRKGRHEALMEAGQLRGEKRDDRKAAKRLPEVEAEVGRLEERSEGLQRQVEALITERSQANARTLQAKRFERKWRLVAIVLAAITLAAIAATFLM